MRLQFVRLLFRLASSSSERGLLKLGPLLAGWQRLVESAELGNERDGDTEMRFLFLLIPRGAFAYVRRSTATATATELDDSGSLQVRVLQLERQTLLAEVTMNLLYNVRRASTCCIIDQVLILWTSGSS